MVFGVKQLVSYISQFMSLLPGDVISTGTPPGVAGPEAAALPEGRRCHAPGHRGPGVRAENPRLVALSGSPRGDRLLASRPEPQHAMPAKKQTAPALPDSSSVAAPAEADGGALRGARAGKGLDILEARASSAGYTLAELAHRIDRSVSEIFRMAVTLQRRGYAGRRERPLHPHAQDVRAGAPPAAAEIAGQRGALPRELASRARQSCHLAVYQGGRVVVIAQVESPERWSFGLKVGVSMGLTDTSSGHVLLAFRDEVERTRMLAAHIKVEGELESDPGELFAILAEVRQRGCASMPSRQIRGITNVATP